MVEARQAHHDTTARRRHWRALRDTGLVALDYDDDEAALSISPHFPESPVNKAGQTAWTGFYRADFPVPSENVYRRQRPSRFRKYSLMGARQ